MVYYEANKEKGKKSYKEAFKAYPSFFLGILGCLACMLAIGYFTYDAVMAKNAPNVPGIAVAALLIFPSVIIMLSGGRRRFLKRNVEVVSIYADHVSVEFVPNKKKYALIRQDFYYCDIVSMCYQVKKKRLKIVSGCQEQRIKSLDDTDKVSNKELIDKEMGSYYIYDQYDQFNELLENLEKQSMKKIEK